MSRCQNNVCLFECGEWNNFEPNVLQSMSISQPVRYGLAVNLGQTAFQSDGACYGITAFRGHDQPPDDQPPEGYSQYDMGCILTFGQIAVPLYHGTGIAGQRARVDSAGNICGSKVGSPNTFLLYNVVFDKDAFQGDIATVRVLNY